MYNIKLCLYLQIILIILSNNYISYSAPIYYIDTPTHKYFLDQPAILTQYWNHNNQITSGKNQIIFTCPDGFKILDFAVASHNLTTIMGVLLTNRSRAYLEIWDLNTSSRLFVKNMTQYQPWKILFSDVDQDSIIEVCLGVYKKSPLHPVFAKRLFIYNFEKGLQPKWLGSRLARPFKDFSFFKINDQTTLISLELNHKDQTCLNSYIWDCFGFTGIETGFNNTFINANSLNTGYVFQSNKYQPALFVLNHNAVAKIIAKPEE
jgi:hypothetical protein